MFLVLALVLARGNIPSNLYPIGSAAYALSAGIFGAAGTALDVHAMDVYTGRGILGSVTERNFINDFAYMDTVFVLVGSIIIGSFTYQQVIGGIAITIGVIVLSRAKRIRKRG